MLIQSFIGQKIIAFDQNGNLGPVLKGDGEMGRFTFFQFRRNQLLHIQYFLFSRGVSPFIDANGINFVDQVRIRLGAFIADVSIHPKPIQGAVFVQLHSLLFRPF